MRSQLEVDFHSRTAMGMYPHIASAVDSGDVLLEWDEKEGESAKVPLLKDKYASERRQSKVLNFSIAYGKTATRSLERFRCECERSTEYCREMYVVFEREARDDFSSSRFFYVTQITSISLVVSLTQHLKL